MNVAVHPAKPAEEAEPGFSAFMLPDTNAEASRERVLHLLQVVGFYILMKIDVDVRTTSSVARFFTLSNFGPDPSVFPGEQSGLVVFATDIMPRQAEAGSPFDNRRTLAAQRVMRDLFGTTRKHAGQGDGVWMTAKSADAWAVLRTLAPAAAPRLKSQIAEKREEFESEPPLASLTSYGDRARVELISFEGTKAVRKTYRPTALHLLEREVQVMRDLSGKLPEIPRLLAHGPNFLVMEYLQGKELGHRRREQPQPLPLAKVRELADFVRRCVAEGYDPIDLKPARNVIYHKSGIAIFDFEYWRKSHPARAEDSYCLNGVPADDESDRPVLTTSWSNPYPTGWFPYVCLSKNCLLHDPEWLQRVKRPWFIALAYMQWSGRLAARVRQLLKGEGW